MCVNISNVQKIYGIEIKRVRERMFVREKERDRERECVC